MPKDFAARPRQAAPRKKRKPVKKRPPARPTRPAFHGPSFSAGALLGAMVIIGAANLDRLLPGSATPEVSVVAAPNEVTFEFDRLLKNAQVPADSTFYVDPADNAAIPDEFLLQAASFRSARDAEAFRARLLLMHLPVSMAKVQLDSGAWYRVLVGPFQTQPDARQAFNRLRDQNVPVMWIKKKNR